MEKVKQVLRFASAVAVVLCAYWNVVAFDLASENVAPRESDEIVRQEKRLAPIRQILIENRYPNGEIAFITNRELAGLPPLPEEDKQWAQAQYVMIPWVLDRQKRSTPFIIADFWDGAPTSTSDRLSKLYDAGDGLVLFQRRQLP